MSDSSRCVNSGHGNAGAARVAVKPNELNMTRQAMTRVRELFTGGLSRYERLMHRDCVETIFHGLAAWRRKRAREIRQRAKQVPRHARRRWFLEVQSKLGDPRDPASADLRDLFGFLCLHVEQELRLLEDLKQRHADFRRSLAHASSQQENHRLIRGFLRCA